MIETVGVEFRESKNDFDPFERKRQQEFKAFLFLIFWPNVKQKIYCILKFSFSRA